MKASDLTDDQVIAVLQHFLDNGCRTVSLWGIQDSLLEFHSKVVTAKLASMVRRGVIDGTARDGDRGDFSLKKEAK